ncbi:hypothetical protein LSH36_371g04026 [Paralvinella palmiformis]|uniref:cytidine deaminase n=1 Tax=Paralvinella palmiformis TaxID=53620 RepID=A0AAD9JEJ4_9ANNE|nr:hypothetical protein LSH36_371g04026 [Paralvinella palmiformis]
MSDIFHEASHDTMWTSCKSPIHIKYVEDPVPRKSFQQLIRPDWINSDDAAKAYVALSHHDLMAEEDRLDNIPTDYPQIEKLIDLACKAKDKAYCPYSKFPVGSAALSKDGTYFTGCNVENAAYPLGVCAEKAVIVKAVTEGHRSFQAVAVCSSMKNSFISPCGSCRQFLSEFGMDMDVYMTKSDRSFVKMKIRELLPLGFEADKLDEERVEMPRTTSSPSGQLTVDSVLNDSTRTDINATV